MQALEDYIPFTGFEIIDDINNINESAQSEVANSKGAILAIVKGPHFCPGKVSRNHRRYTEELWETVSKDEELNKRLAGNQVIGRIGHEAEMTDMDVAKGEFSHYTRNIDWKTGIAESVIVNTPMGNTLLTLLRSKVTMYVSSRADGDYCGKDEDGNDILDPKTFKLERFDFVQDPGFLDAHPKMITESKQTEAPVDEVKSLLMVASEVGAPLTLDARQYIIERFETEGPVLKDTEDDTSDSYKYEEFTEVTDDIRRSILEHFNSQAKRVETLEKELEAARFANKKGLNEDYVVDRLKNGATYESLEGEGVKPQEFKLITEAAPTTTQSEDTFLSRLFS